MIKIVNVVIPPNEKAVKLYSYTVCKLSLKNMKESNIKNRQMRIIIHIFYFVDLIL